MYYNLLKSNQRIQVPDIVSPGVLRQYFYLYQKDQKKLEDQIRYVQTNEKNEEMRRIALTGYLKTVKLPKFFCVDHFVGPCVPASLCCKTSMDKPLVLEEVKDEKSGLYYIRLCHYGICQRTLDTQLKYYKVKGLIEESNVLGLPVNKQEDCIYVPAIEIFKNDIRLLYSLLYLLETKETQGLARFWNAYWMKDDESESGLENYLSSVDAGDPCRYNILPRINICQPKKRSDRYVFPILIVMLIIYFLFSVAL